MKAWSWVGGDLYSAPDTTRKRRVEVQHHPGEVRIFEDGALIASHPVLKGKNQRRVEPKQVFRKVVGGFRTKNLQKQKSQAGFRGRSRENLLGVGSARSSRGGADKRDFGCAKRRRPLKPWRVPG